MGLKAQQITSSLTQALINCSNRLQSQAARDNCQMGVEFVQNALMARSKSLEGRKRLGQIELGGSIAVLPLIAAGVLGVVASGIGSLLVRILVPAPVPGDGFTVRWMDNKNVQNSLGFGSAFKEAFEYAKTISDKYPVVEVVEVRQGNIVAITRAGQKTVFSSLPAESGAQPGGED